jgi:hypothetical protein
MSIFNEVHKRFLSLLIKNEVEFLLLGGYAVILHGGNRTTSDIDLLIKPTKENGEKVLKTFAESGLEIEDISPEDFETEMFLSFGFEPEAVDLMTFTKGITFDQAYSNAAFITIDSQTFKLIDIRDLIKNKESLNREGKKALLDKYDTEELKEIIKNKKRK